MNGIDRGGTEARRVGMIRVEQNLGFLAVQVADREFVAADQSRRDVARHAIPDQTRPRENHQPVLSPDLFRELLDHRTPERDRHVGVGEGLKLIHHQNERHAGRREQRGDAFQGAHGDVGGVGRRLGGGHREQRSLAGQPRFTRIGAAQPVEGRASKIGIVQQSDRLRDGIGDRRGAGLRDALLQIEVKFIPIQDLFVVYAVSSAAPSTSSRERPSLAAAAPVRWIAMRRSATPTTSCMTGSVKLRSN